MLEAMASTGLELPVESNVRALPRFKWTRCVEASMITRETWILEEQKKGLLFRVKFAFLENEQNFFLHLLFSSVITHHIKYGLNLNASRT